MSGRTRHQAAVRLLSGVATEPARHLGRLLSITSKAAYTGQTVSAADLRTAKRAAEHLLDAARRV